MSVSLKELTVKYVPRVVSYN